MKPSKPTARKKPIYRQNKALLWACLFGLLYSLLQVLHLIISITTTASDVLGFAFIFFIMTAPIPLVLSTSLIPRGLKSWHLQDCPEHAPPLVSTDAQNERHTWMRGSAVAGFSAMALALVSVVVFDLIGPAVSLTLVAIGCLIYCITFWVALPNPRQSRRAQETSVKRTANAPWAKRIEKREYRGEGCVVAALVGIVLLRLLGLFGFSLPTSEPMRTVVVAIAGGGVLLLAFAYTRWRTKRAA